MNDTPPYGYSYGILTGTYVGEILVFLEETEEDFNFISIPKNLNRSVPKNKFFSGIKSNIVDPIKQIDSDVLQLLELQYNHNKENK